MLSALHEQATVQYRCEYVLPCYSTSWSYKAYLMEAATTSRKMMVPEYPKVPCVFVHLEIKCTLSVYMCISAVGPFLSSQTESSQLNRTHQRSIIATEPTAVCGAWDASSSRRARASHKDSQWYTDCWRKTTSLSSTIVIQFDTVQGAEH